MCGMAIYQMKPEEDILNISKVTQLLLRYRTDVEIIETMRIKKSILKLFSNSNECIHTIDCISYVKANGVCANRYYIKVDNTWTRIDIPQAAKI